MHFLGLLLESFGPEPFATEGVFVAELLRLFPESAAERLSFFLEGNFFGDDLDAFGRRFFNALRRVSSSLSLLSKSNTSSLCFRTFFFDFEADEVVLIASNRDFISSMAPEYGGELESLVGVRGLGG
jgi:hypothetical protein